MTVLKKLDMELSKQAKLIAGAGGKKGSSSGGNEAPDTLESKAYMALLDLLGEGQIGGIVDDSPKSIFLNDTPLMNTFGTYNFKDVTWGFVDGAQNQSPIGDGFNEVEATYSLSQKVEAGTPITFTVTDPNADKVRAVMAVPALINSDKKGNINGSKVQFAFAVSLNNGPYDEIDTAEISGKTRSRFQREYTYELPKTTSSGKRVTMWSFRVTRLTPNSTTTSVQNDLYIDNYSVITSTRLSYPNSAMVGLSFDSEQFNGVPNRSYLVDGLLIKVPSNRNPKTREYTGPWNGTFTLASSDNPAWIMYDLITNNRYGLGNFISAAFANPARLYTIGRYCDEMIDDGYGGKEPRFSINTSITSRVDAYRLISDIASVFNGMAFWTGGELGYMADMPTQVSMIYTSANVIDGLFTYSGASRKDIHTVALVTWNNPERNYEPEIEYVEDAKLIDRFGIRKAEIVAFGCTSRAQAHRVGKWLLYTEQHQSKTVSFRVGIDSAFVLPGDVIQILDADRAGKRHGGRLLSCTATSAKLDSAFEFETGASIMMRLEDGSFEERLIDKVSGKTVSWVTPLTTLPIKHAMWVVKTPTLEPMTARVVSVGQGENVGELSITAIQHNATKFDSIESDINLETPVLTTIDSSLISPTKAVIITSEGRIEQGIAIRDMIISWEQVKEAVSYEAQYRKGEGNWFTLPVTKLLSAEVPNISQGDYTAKVVAISANGARSTSVMSIKTTLDGQVTQLPKLGKFTAKPAQFGIDLAWEYGANTTGVSHTEIEFSATEKYNWTLLGTYPDPLKAHNVAGLNLSERRWFRARVVDKFGFASAWSNIAVATPDTDASKVLEVIGGKIGIPELSEGIKTNLDSMRNDIDVNVQAITDEAAARSNEIATKTAAEAAARAEALRLEAEKRTAEIKAKDDAQTAALAAEAAARSQEVATKVAAEATARSKEIATKVATETTNRTNAIKAETTARVAAIDAKAGELRVEFDGKVSNVQNGITKEITDRQTEDSRIVGELNAFKTTTGDNLAVATKNIQTVTTAQAATASEVSGLKTSMKDVQGTLETKADNSAVSSLKTEVIKQGEDLANKSDQITSLTADIESINLRGQDLVSNGLGQLKNNKYWSGAIFTAADKPAGVGSFILGSGKASIIGDEYIAVDPTRAYRLSYSLRQLNPGVVTRAYGMFVPCDVDKMAISTSHYMAQTNTLTRLAKPLKKGDTTITLEDAKNWNTQANAATHLRSAIFWNYVDGTGYSWPANTYSRNYTSDLYQPGAISGNVITLTKPWSGLEMAAGTEVSNGSSGGSYMYIGAKGSTVTEEWTQYSGDVTGVHQSGKPAAAVDKLPVAAAYVRIGFLVNRQASGANDPNSAMAFGAVSLRDWSIASDTSLAKADALNATNAEVTRVGDVVTAQGTSISKLQSDLKAADEKAGKAVTNAATAQNTANTAVTANSATATRVESLEAKVNVVEGAVAKKADASTLNSYSTITDRDKAIAEGVNRYDASLVIGGVNLFNPAKLEKLAISGTIVGPSDKYMSYTLPVTPGEVYSISRKTISSNRFRYAFTKTLPAKGVAVFGGTGDETNKLLKIENIVVPAEAAYLYLYLSQAGDAPVTDVQIERGSKASDFNESPEVVRESIEGNASAINATNATVKEVNGQVQANTSDIRSLDSSIKAVDGKTNTAISAAAQAQSTADTAVSNEQATSQRLNSLQSSFEALSTAGRNLLQASNIELARNDGDYLMGAYKIGQLAEVGKTYTLVACVTTEKAATDTKCFLSAYQGAGSPIRFDAEVAGSPNKTRQVISQTFKWTQTNESNRKAVNFYWMPRDNENGRTSKATVHWACLYEGEVLPVSDWEQSPFDADEKFASTNAAIGSLNETLTKADQAIALRVDTLTATVSGNDVTVKGLITDATKSISTLEGNTNTKINGLESKVSAVEGAVAKKADSSVLNDYYTKSQTEGKALEIAAGEVSKYNANLQIGGVNLIRGEPDIKLSSNNGTVYPILNTVVDGVRHVERVAPFDNAVLSTYVNAAYVNVEAGKTYTWSIEVKPTKGTLSLRTMAMALTDNGIAPFPSAVYGSYVDCPKDVWTKLTVTVTAVNSGRVRPSPIHGSNITADTGAIAYRNFQIEEGTKATAFVESPLDTQSKLSANADAINVTNVEVARVDGEVKSQAKTVSKLQSDLTAVDTKAGTAIANAANAQTTANTAVTANSATANRVGSLEAKMDNVTLDNLVVGGNVAKTKEAGISKYLAFTYPLSRAVTIGKQYTVRAKISFSRPAGDTTSELWLYIGSDTRFNRDTQPIKAADGEIFEFTAVPAKVNDTVAFYIGPNGASTADTVLTVHWVEFYEGRNTLLDATAAEINATNAEVKKVDGRVTSTVNTLDALDNTVKSNHTAVTGSIKDVKDSVATLEGTTNTRFNSLDSAIKAADTKAGTAVSNAATAQSTANTAVTAAQSNASNVSKLQATFESSRDSDSLVSDYNMALGSEWEHNYTTADLSDRFVAVADGPVSNTAYQKTGSTGSASRYDIVHNKTPLPAGPDYIVSYYCKRTAGSTGTSYVSIGIKNSSGNIRYDSPTAITSQTPADGEWHKVEHTVKTATAKATTVYMGFGVNHGDTDPAHIAWIQGFHVRRVVTVADTDATIASKANLDSVQTALANADTAITRRIDTMDTSIANTNTAVQGQIKNIQDSVTTLSGNTNTKLDQLTSGLETANGAIKTKADQTSLNQTNTKLDTVSGKVETQASSINTLTSKTTTLTNDLTTTDMLMRAMASGKLVFGDPTFKNGTNNVTVYNNSNNGLVTLTRIAKQATNPTSSDYELRITSTGAVSPGLGGFVQGVNARPNAVFLVKYIICLPVGYQLLHASNAVGTGGSSNFIGSTEGTGKYETYYRLIKCGDSGSFSSSGHVYATGPTPSAANPLIWYLASIELYDATDFDDMTPVLRDTVATIQSQVNTLTTDTKAVAEKYESMSAYVEYPETVDNDRLTVDNTTTAANRWTYYSMIAEGDMATAQAVEQMKAEVEDTMAVWNSEFKLEVEKGIASNAEKIDTLTGQLGDSITKIQTTTAVVDGIKGQYTVKIDNNGVLSGFSLVSEQEQGKVISTFGVDVNNFYIGAPSNGEKLFIVTTESQEIEGVIYPPGTWINSAYIAEASIKLAHIDRADITSLSALTANIGLLRTAESGARTEIRDNLIEVFDENDVVRVRIGIFNKAS